MNKNLLSALGQWPLVFVILLTTAMPLAVRAMHAPQPAALRLGIISLAPPARIHKQWQAFADHLGKRLGKPVEIIVPRGFARIKEAVDKRHVEIFYINSHIFYRLKQRGLARAVAQMQNLDGKTTSRSVILVRGDSPIHSLDQLKGRTMAFVSPMGAGGYLAPRARLFAAGVNSTKDIDEQFTKNLTTSLHKLILGDVQAATMCGLNYQLMSRRIATGDLRILDYTGDYPENVIAARPDLPPALIERLQAIIVGMADDQDGQKILADMRGMKIRRFVRYDPAAEALTKRLLELGQFRPAP